MRFQRQTIQRIASQGHSLIVALLRDLTSMVEIHAHSDKVLFSNRRVNFGHKGVRNNPVLAAQFAAYTAPPCAPQRANLLACKC